jgi:hypothetical protein
MILLQILGDTLTRAKPALESVSTSGIELARNPAGPSQLTSIPLYDSTRSERSTSVVTNNSGVVNGLRHETSQPQQGQTESPWARSLFTLVHSQHLLFEKDDPSMNTSGNHERLCIDPTVSTSTLGSSSRSSSAALERHAKTPDKYRARRELLNETGPDGNCVTISSHLFSAVGTLPLSLPINLQLLGMQDLTAPAWAIVPMYRNDDPDMMSAAYVDFINESKRLITSGIAPERLFGRVPNVEVLLNEVKF